MNRISAKDNPTNGFNIPKPLLYIQIWQSRDLPVRRSQRGEKVVFKNVKQASSPSLTPIFSFLVSAPVIRDGHLEHAAFQLGDLCGHFHLKGKPAGSNHHIADNFSTESFVAGFDIRKIVIGEQVGKKGDEAVGQIMAEIKDARGPTHKETRTVNHICLAVQNRLNHIGDVRRGVLQVGILHVTISQVEAAKPVLRASVFPRLDGWRIIRTLGWTTMNSSTGERFRRRSRHR